MRPHYLATLFIAAAAIIVLLSFLLVFTSKNKELNQVSILNRSIIEQTGIKPIVPPLTETEANDTLLMTDTEIQNTVNQMDQDLNETNSIDTSIDNQSL